MILKINNISFRHQGFKNLIDGFSLSLEPDQMVLVQGVSGSGKSTLINLIGGYVKPNSGSIEVFGQDLSKISEHSMVKIRRRLGMIGQSSNLLKDMSVIENVMMPMLLDGKSSKEAWDESNKILDRVGLLDKQSRSVLELSGGEEQRVAIARALVNNPGLILADEATSSLDLINAENILSLCIEIIKERQIAMIWTTHHPLHANLFDKSVVMG